MEENGFRHWRLDTDLDGICWLTLDRDGESANSLSRDVLEELEQVVTHLENHPPAGLILQSGKPGSFIVGADVREFDDVNSSDEAEDFIHHVHQLLNRIEALDFPTAAAIEGFCLGGGLELSLAFDWILALDVDHTRIGFPEVKLGIYPGFGGSARSIARCGPLKAMPIMLSARMLRARQARGIGLIDEVVREHSSLRWAARRAILKGRKNKGAGRAASVQNMAPMRGFLAGQMRKQTAAKANPNHYPAPFELIEAWEKHGDDLYAMMAEEVTRVGHLITTDTSKNLRRIFALTERLKGYGKGSEFKARRVHVIGAGTMGGDIAAWCVVRGLEVTLQDREHKYIEPALKRAKSLFKKRLKTPDRVAGALSRLIPDVDGKGVERADVIIEAIFENAEAKQALFKDIEPRMQEHAILATNTSAIPLDELSGVLKKPERLIGLHFFNPVAKMPLVEVVRDERTTDDQVANGAAFCNQIGRFPLPCKSGPGFLVNRVLSPYLLEAFRLHHNEGIPIQDLDKAATQFGMPMGPVELADVVGLDIGLSVLGHLGGEGADAERQLLQSYVDAGKLGKKSGEGFYVWEKGKPKKDDTRSSAKELGDLAERLLAPYFAECRSALSDEVVEDGDVLDAGMVFGTGFAPFRGGPLHYLASLGEEVSDVEVASPTEPESVPEPEPAPEPEPTPEPAPESEPEPEPDPEPGSEAEPEAEKSPEPETESEPKPKQSAEGNKDE